MIEDPITKKFHEVLLVILQDFDAFCVKHNLSYVAAYGTILGAVRHKGIIPWDDDLDVFMSWPDYVKFLSLRKEASNAGYQIVDRKDTGYYLPMAKFCDTKTTIVEDRWNPYAFGIYIDVFPIGFVKDQTRSKVLHDEYKKWSILLTRACKRYDLSWATIKHFIGHPQEVFEDYSLRGRLSEIQNELDKLDDEILAITDGEYMRYYRAMNTFERSLYRREWILDTIEVPFDTTHIRIPRDYDSFLTRCYGDYMTPPPPENQITHHKHFYLNMKEHLSMDEVKRRLAKGERTVL